MVLNPLNFCLSEKLFISPSILNEILAGYSNLDYRFFPFNTLNISCLSLLACRISAERSTVKCMGFHLYVTCCPSLAAFNILSLCLIFVSLISICLRVFLLGLKLSAEELMLLNCGVGENSWESLGLLFLHGRLSSSWFIYLFNN